MIPLLIHVRSARGGAWTVRPGDGGDRPVSVHAGETGAERAGLRPLGERGAAGPVR